MQNTFWAKYYYQREGSGSKHTTSIDVKAESELVAIELAKMQAAAKHPGCNVVILEIKKK